MKKILKSTLYGLVVIVIIYFSWFFYGIIRYSHSPDFYTYKQYMWIFKNSVKKDIDTNFSYSCVKKRDIYNNMHYKGSSYNIIVWEFKDLSSVNLKNININKNINLDNIDFTSGETLNAKSDLEITINYGFEFNNKMNVNLDAASIIKKNIQGINYKGFYGIINEMSLSDEKNEHQIIFNYTKGETPTLLLLYKGHQSFYLILINSEETFDESLINIFNLE